MATVDIGSLMNNRLEPEMKAAYNAVEGLTGAMKNLGDTSGKETEDMIQSFQALNKLLDLSKQTKSISDFIKKMNEINSSVQNLEISLQELMGSADKVQKFIEDLMNYSGESIFEIQDLAAASIQLMSVGTEAEKVIGVLDQLSNIATATQTPLDGLIQLYSNAQSTGEVNSSDLAAWATHGVLIIDVLKNLGIEIINSTIKLEELENVLVNLTSGNGEFAGAMKAQMSEISEGLKQLQESFDQVYERMGKQLSEGPKTENQVLDILVGNYTDLGEAISKMLNLYNHYRIAMVAVNAIQKAHTLLQVETALAGGTLTVAQGLQAVATKGLQRAWERLNAIMLANPYALIAGLVAALGYSIYKVATQSTAFTEAQERLNQANSEVTQSTVSELRKLAEYEKKLAETTQGTKEYEEIKNKIVSEYGTYHSALDTEIEKTGSLASAYDQLSLSIRKSIAERKFEEIYTQEQKHLDKVISENLDKGYEEITKKFPGQEGLDLYKQFYEYAIRGAEMSRETWKKLNEVTFLEFGFDHSPVGIAQRSVTGLSTDIFSQKRASENILNEYQQRYNLESSDSGPQQTTEKKLDDANELLKNTKADIKKFEKELADLRSGKRKVEEGSLLQVIQDKERELSNANKALEQLSGKKDKKPQTVSPDNKSDLTQMLQERVKLEKNFQKKISDARIQTENEKEEKILTQQELNNKREIDELKRQKEDYINAYIQQSEEIHNAEQELKANKDKNYTKQEFKNPDIDTSSIDDLIRDKEKIQAERKQEAEEKAWNEYLIKYGEYQEKRKAIIDKFNQEIEQASTKGDKATLEREKQSQLEQLDNAIKASTTLMADLFADASKKSVTEVESIIQKTELLLEYLKAVKNDEGFAMIGDKLVSQGDIMAMGISEEELNGLTQSEEGIKKIDEALKKLKGNLGSKSPFQTFKKQIEEAAEKIGQGGKDNIAEGIIGIASAIDAFAPSIKQFGNDLGSLFGDEEFGKQVELAVDGIQGLGQGATGAAKIMSGDLLGGVMDVVSGISKAVNAFGNLFGGENGTAYYERIKKQLGAINKIYERVISNNKENIFFGGGMESIEAANDALDTYYKKEENLQKIAKASGKSGSSWKSRSAQHKTNKRIKDSEYAAMGEEIGKDINGVQDLYNLSGEELYQIASKMPEVWGKIDGRIRENLESIIDCKDEAKELQDALNQAVTGIDQNSFYNDFLSNLSDMDASFEDMCKNFEGYLRKSIIAAMVAANYKHRIDKLYENWAKAGEDGVITAEEAAKLKKEQESIARDAMKDINDMDEAMGWEYLGADSSSSQQSAQAGAFTTMTQDQAGKLEGLFTSVQNHVSSMDDKMTNLSSAMYDSVDMLVKIEENTSFCRELEVIRQDIKAIIRDGLKMK